MALRKLLSGTVCRPIAINIADGLIYGDFQICVVFANDLPGFVQKERALGRIQHILGAGGSSGGRKAVERVHPLIDKNLGFRREIHEPVSI